MKRIKRNKPSKQRSDSNNTSLWNEQQPSKVKPIPIAQYLAERSKD
jgi:hypothetical protein